MYKVIGYFFTHKSDGTIEKRPIPAHVVTPGYQELHEALKLVGITHYMCILKEMNENGSVCLQ